MMREWDLLRNKVSAVVDSSDIPMHIIRPTMGTGASVDIVKRDIPYTGW